MPVTVELTQFQLNLIIGALETHTKDLRFTALEAPYRELCDILLKLAENTNKEST